MLNVAESIEKKLMKFSPTYVEVINESHMHKGPPNSETHFKVILVSETFIGRTRLDRHQQVNCLLSEELSGPIHALSIQAHTPSEWKKRGGEILLSPDCRNGSTEIVAK